MNFRKTWILAIVLMVTFGYADAQLKNRLQPGKMYGAGEKIYSPKYGFTSVIPEGWEGTLPRESEIFLLVPEAQIGGEVFTFISFQKDLESIKQSWKNGVDLTETIKIKAAGEITQDGDKIYAEVIPAGQAVNKGYKGFATAACSPHGFCVTSLGIGPVQFYDQIKKAVSSFTATTTFSEPSNVSLYVDFDWKEFLSNKSLISYAAVETASGSGEKENLFELCKDGTFTSKMKKKGMLKYMNKEYKGRQSGTWSTSSIGETGKLKLVFKRLPEVEVSLLIKDEKIYINEERYFAARSEACKD